MIVQWTSQFKDIEDKRRFERSVISSKPVLDRQIEILDDMRDALNSEDKGLSQFDTPAWECKQAYILGYRAALTDIRALINLENQILPDHKE